MEVRYFCSWRIWVFGLSWGKPFLDPDARYFALNLGPFCVMWEWNE